MTVVHELQQVLFVQTPHGKGQALFIIDYGIHENTIWVIALNNTREIKHYSSMQLKVWPNYKLNNL